MKILFSSYQSISLMKGGPTYKIKCLKESLENLSIKVDLFDPWNNNSIRNYDLVHIFNAHSGVYHFAESLKNKNINYIVNPIFYSKHSSNTIRLYLFLQSQINKIIRGTISEISMVKSVCQNAQLIMPNTIKEEKLIKYGMGLKNLNFKTIHNGVEKRFINCDPNLFIKKYNVSDFILHVGHIGANRKNTFRFLKAVNAIDYPVVIIGNVLNNDEGKKCLELINSNKNILFLDWIGHSDPMLASAYAASRLFVLPSLYETPGRAALEAGLAGSNIAITKHGGTKEYFSDFANYINPYSIQSIKKSIINGINSTKSSNLSKHIEKNFLWDKIANQIKNEYIKIIKNKKHASS